MESQEKQSGFTIRSLVVGLVFMILTTVWVRSAELITFSCQVTESTPTIPAIAAVLILGLLVPLLRRFGKALTLSRAEMGAIYIFVAVGGIMPSVGMIRLLLPSLTVPFYFATPQNRFEEIQPFIPAWMAPQDSEVVRGFYEGAEGAVVPWDAWILPSLRWTAFIAALWLVMLCISVLFRQQWTERERLAFPLLYIPLNLVEGLHGTGEQRPFFKNPVMWLGFGAAALFNLTNILNAFNPSIMALGQSFNFGALFTEKPLIGLRPLVINHRPELLGLAYLMSSDVLLSVWLFYLLERVGSMISLMFGHQIAGFPFEREQGAGAYVAMALFLVWVARRHLWRVLRQVMGGKRAAADSSSPSDAAEPLPYRVAVVGLILGLGFLFGWCWKAGMAFRVIGIYFFLLVCFYFVYMRLRAETGTPSTWLIPYYQAKHVPLHIFGSEFFKVGGSFQSLTLWSTHFFLTRGFFNAAAGYQPESFKLADETGMPRRQMVWVLILAVLVGCLLAFWMHLGVYYDYGCNVLEGGSTEGGFRTYLAIHEYQDTTSYLNVPKTRDVPRTIAVGFGFGLTTLLVLCRIILLRFPLNPLGYAMSMTIGSHLWSSCLAVWILKHILFKLGGVRLYRRLLPAFLGLALGHFFTAGIVWGTLSGFLGETAKRYIVWFA